MKPNDPPETRLLVWGLPRGAAERWEESLLAESCRTDADVARVKDAAARDGWHSFRVSRFTEGEKPDFGKAVTRRPPARPRER